MKIQNLKLKGLPNTRDLGGMPTSDGKTIAHGRLIRSGKLYKLPEKTAKALADAGVTAVADMRTDTERGKYPDTLIEGAKYFTFPLAFTATEEIPCVRHIKLLSAESRRLKSEFGGDEDNYMKSLYSLLLFGERYTAALRELFRLLLENEGCMLWHCGGGKDRAGLIAMLTEGILGVDEELIIEDYLASRYFLRIKRGWQKFGLTIAPLRQRFKHILYGIMFAKREYIEHALEEIKARCGTFDGYFRQYLGFSDDDIERFRQNYLE